MKVAIAATAAILLGTALPVLAFGQAHEPDKQGGGGMMGGGMMGGHGGMGGGMMMSGQMMGGKSKQIAAMSEMMRSMGEAMEMQAHSMKGKEMAARHDAMMKIGKDAKSVASTMMRMSSEMGKLHDMGAMPMDPKAGEMMGKSMAAQKEAMQMMQKEAESAPAQ